MKRIELEQFRLILWNFNVKKFCVGCWLADFMENLLLAFATTNHADNYDAELQVSAKNMRDYLAF